MEESDLKSISDKEKKWQLVPKFKINFWISYVLGKDIYLFTESIYSDQSLHE